MWTMQTNNSHENQEIKKSPCSLLGKPEQGTKHFFLKSKKEFQIRPEELGRSKTHPTGENSNKEQSN
jgi:hypothetical protein